VRTASSPEQALLEFFQSTYEAGARLAQWDREALERKARWEPSVTRSWSRSWTARSPDASVRQASVAQTGTACWKTLWKSLFVDGRRESTTL